MDVAVLQALQNVWAKGLERVVMTYDIMCKYKIYLHLRASSNPHCPLEERFLDRLRVESPEFIKKLNVYHQLGHKPECADDHSMRNTVNVGRMSGEDIKSSWAKTNKQQYSTREMDTGARRDCISSHMEAVNYEKIRTLREKHFQ